MNNKLTERRASLVEEFNKAASQLQELEARKTDIIGNANAIKGAIMLIDELLAPQPDDAKTEDLEQCPVVPINQ